MDEQVRVTQRVEAGAVALTALVAVILLYAVVVGVVPCGVPRLRPLDAGVRTIDRRRRHDVQRGPQLRVPGGCGADRARRGSDVRALSTTAGVLACSWAFHVGVDRALGYGLKLPDSFRNTHLGQIGGQRQPR